MNFYFSAILATYFKVVNSPKLISRLQISSKLATLIVSFFLRCFYFTWLLCGCFAVQWLDSRRSWQDFSTLLKETLDLALIFLNDQTDSYLEQFFRETAYLLSLAENGNYFSMAEFSCSKRLFSEYDFHHSQMLHTHQTINFPICFFYDLMKWPEYGPLFSHCRRIISPPVYSVFPTWSLYNYLSLIWRN